MPRAKDPPPILFCPFCRDGFEGRSECPEHELALVAIDRLPRGVRHGTQSVSFFGDPRLGRGPVLLGAALVVGGFVAPFVSTGILTQSALEVAIDGAANLWLVPGAALALLWILWRRRSRQAMRAARAAALGLAIGGALPVVYTVRRVDLVAAAREAPLDWHYGLWLMVLGLVLAAIGSVRLGSGPD